MIIKSVYLLAFIAIFLSLFIGLGLRKILFNRLAKWSKRTKTQIDDIIISSIQGPFIIWCLMIGFYIAVAISSLPDKIVNITSKILIVFGIISSSVVFAAIIPKLIKLYSEKLETRLPLTSLTQNISKVIIFGIGILIVLNTLGISITPILATLGVGGLAVALALQDSLSNLFAGFHITTNRQIRIGDYIKLETGEEGYVTDINWRTTKIKMLPNNIVLIPNVKLGQAIVTNYYLPDKEMAVLVNLGVHYNSDLEKVETVTCQVAEEVMKDVPGGVLEFKPFIRYNTFADSSINLTVILRAKEYTDQYLIKHEFIKRLSKKYKKEGIVIPYPIRAINYIQEGVK